jgi:rhodanese-related sulfurtransferase
MADIIAADRLKAKLDEGGQFILLDVLPPSSYLVAHLPGAANVPLDYLHDVMEVLPQDYEIIVYCRNKDCELSQVAAQRLELHGYTKVHRFKDGLAGWKQAGYELEALIKPSP